MTSAQPVLRPEPTPETLAHLLQAVASEDGAALGKLYDLASPKLFGLALRILARREWAEEVLQDSFINIWRFAADYRSDLSAPMTWMAAIVRNGALDHLRRTHATETEWNDAYDEWLAAPGASVDEQVAMTEDARRLAGCMARLEASQRQAVALAYLRDQSHSEIAASMHAPLGTVKSWVRRGLEKLKTCLGDA